MNTELLAALQTKCNESSSSSWSNGKAYPLGEHDLIIVAELQGEDEDECEWYLHNAMTQTVDDWINEIVQDKSFDIIPVYMMNSTGGVIVKIH